MRILNNLIVLERHIIFQEIYTQQNLELISSYHSFEEMEEYSHQTEMAHLQTFEQIYEEHHDVLSFDHYYSEYYEATQQLIETYEHFHQYHDIFSNYSHHIHVEQSELLLLEFDDYSLFLSVFNAQIISIHEHSQVQEFPVSPLTQP